MMKILSQLRLRNVVVVKNQFNYGSKMNNWILTSECLPEINKPVLCIIKTKCTCDHYAPIILVRVETDNGFFWEVPGISDQISFCFDKDHVKAWQKVEVFPIQFPEGFMR